MELGAGEVADRRQVTGKHRTTAVSADTPIGFWDIGMPDTEQINQIIKQNQKKL
jgi:hypothetical protein